MNFNPKHIEKEKAEGNLGFIFMEVVYKTKRVIGINKPIGMPSQSDPTGALDAMKATEDLLRQEGENSALWLVHRLDRKVGGALVFARSKEAAAEVSALMQNEKSLKEYLAVTEGEVAPEGVLKDYLYKDARLGKAFVVSRKRAGVKEAELSYSKLAEADTQKGKLSLVKIRLGTGRFHQIRAQFASRRMAIAGDRKYGSRIYMPHGIALFCSHLSLELKDEKVDLSLLPDVSIYPWCEFKKYFEDIK